MIKEVRKIPEGHSNSKIEKSDNAMSTKEKDRQTIVHKTQHRKFKTKQN